MMPPETTALINILMALLIIGVSIPLIFRKIPMNRFYGVRFAKSFKSEKAWYEINEYGGKALIVCMIPNFLYGIYGLIQKPLSYTLISTIVIVISVILAALMIFIKARKVTS
ncbi:SdpI family protein [Akkermansiaceae bacterium]|nr:SdpI family protein [Akkermansiaceae bacterium]